MGAICKRDIYCLFTVEVQSVSGICVFEVRELDLVCLTILCLLLCGLSEGVSLLVMECLLKQKQMLFFPLEISESSTMFGILLFFAFMVSVYGQ